METYKVLHKNYELSNLGNVRKKLKNGTYEKVIPSEVIPSNPNQQPYKQLFIRTNPQARFKIEESIKQLFPEIKEEVSVKKVKKINVKPKVLIEEVPTVNLQPPLVEVPKQEPKLVLVKNELDGNYVFVVEDENIPKTPKVDTCIEKVKKIYDQKKYNKTFNEKHKEKLSQKLKCPVCGGEYSYYNKSKHNKSKKHISKIPIPV